MDKDRRVGDLIGRIRRRLLVNQWVDPDEVRGHLPDVLRPHVGSGGGVVVGCCMIEIDSARPWPLPSLGGVSIRAAAHRVSVEVGPVHQPTRAVWVPVRHTDSKAAIVAGGRVFPGVHAFADVAVDEANDVLTWSVTGGAEPFGAFDIRAGARLARSDDASSEVGEIVIETALGLSPGRRPTRVEAVEMNPLDHRYSIVELVELSSAFMSGFSSAEPAETLLMTDVDVVWRPTKTAEDVFV